MIPARWALLVLIGVALGFATVAVANAQPAGDNCATCHLALGIANLTKPAEDYQSDIHAAKGFGCAACHGGDPSIMGLEGMDPKKGYVGKPAGRQVVETCGKCHADGAFMRRYNPNLRVDQVAEYYTSVHGKRLRETSDQTKSRNLRQLSQAAFDPAGQRWALLSASVARRRDLRILSRQ